MISLICPLCSEVLKEKDRDELERTFQDHLRSVHAVQDFCVLDEHGHAEGSIQSCQPEVIEKVEGIPRETYDRPVFEYSLRDELEHMPPISESDRENMLGIRCPICGRKVKGTNEQDFSRQLRLHFLGSHSAIMTFEGKEIREG